MGTKADLERGRPFLLRKSMQDFVERLVRHHPKKYSADGLHQFANNRFMVVFLKKGNEIEIMEFKRF